MGQSRPTRARGLKLQVNVNPDDVLCVAPYAGAWIETISARCPLQSRYVAPYAGAWIETYTMVANFLGAIRRALRGRVD